MKTTIMLFFFLSAVAQCQANPKALTAEQQEAISRKLIALQDEELAYQQLQIQMQQAEKRVLAAKDDFDKELGAAKKAAGAAPDCSLSKTKEWSCPK
jgi:hypothetical protein